MTMNTHNLNTALRNTRRSPLSTSRPSLEATIRRTAAALLDDIGPSAFAGSAPGSAFRLAETINAALADITQTGTGLAQPKQWLGELRANATYTPRFVPLLHPDDLTAYEGSGWHWSTAPVAVDYAGDKAAISTAPTGVALDAWTAARIVVAHDVDRSLIDFGGDRAETFIRAYFQAAMNAGLKQLDAKALAYITTAGNQTATTALAGGTTHPLLKAAVRAKVALGDADMGPAEWCLVNSGDYEALADTPDDISNLLDALAIEPGRLIPTSQVATKTVLVGTSGAATLRTPPDLAFTTTAEVPTAGGIDLFSILYWVIEKHTALGIHKGSWL